MAQDDRWIKLFLKFNKWEWYSDSKHVHVFIDLMLRAQWHKSKYKGVDLAPGQMTTSIGAIAERTGLTIQNIRTVLNHLKSTRSLTIKRLPKCLLITIVDWSDYQHSNKVPNNQLTINQQSTNNQLTTYKKIRRIEDKKNRIIHAHTKKLFHFLDDEQQEFINDVKEKKMNAWLQEYNINFLKEEIENAHEWLQAQPKSKQKKAINLFLNNWFKRSNADNKHNPENDPLKKFFDEAEAKAEKVGLPKWHQ